MAFRPFLAMTAAEIRKNPGFSGDIGWMACHFSPYGLGLSNLPQELPPGSLLIVDDVTPIHGHDPALIAAQLAECLKRLSCHGLLLDFQRPGNPESAALAKHLLQALPCPAAVSEAYGKELDCPVCLSPVAPSVPLARHLESWKGRDIWLELAREGEILTLTEQGTQITPLSHPDEEAAGYSDEILHCHYRTEVSDTEARFTLWRTKEDLQALLEEAESLGVTTAVGLWQEFGQT